MSQVIRPRPYSPPPPSASSFFRRVTPPTLVLLVSLVALSLLVTYVFTARAVSIEIVPVPDAYAVSGGWLNLKLGERHLLRPGQYTLRAEKAGYKPLSVQFDVDHSSNQSLAFEMAKLPGLVTFLSEPVSGASVFVDGQLRGSTPLEALELAPGPHAVQVTAERYQNWTADLQVAGALQRQQVDAVLLPAWAQVEIQSDPVAAEVRVDGELLANTPASLELLQGTHLLEISKPGFKTVEQSLEVIAGQDLVLPPVKLEKSDGRVLLDSRPQGANVTVGGIYRGQTPLRLALPPERSYEIQFSRAGYRKEVRNVAVRPGEGRSVSVTLEPEQGTIKVTVTPRDSRVLVNDRLVGTGTQALVLPAVPHRVTVERDGYAPVSREITPRPGFEQDLAITLRTLEQARYDRLAPSVQTSAGQTLKLVRPGSFRTGASRREPGRRANEVIRQIKLTRPFYISTTEVSNEQFRLFDRNHESGIVGRATLNLDKAPVVNIEWQEAARYCNWLSRQDGLIPAYEERDGQLVLKQPVGTGYRLPSEAEWVWAARGGSSNKYPWGQTMPPPAESGNFADDSARPVVARVIAGLNDGHVATAPVASFAANERGLYDFAGNVAEWVHDYYAVNPSPGGAQETDPFGPADGDFNVVRGSSWKHSTITELRWSFRDYSAEPRNDVGFRIARYAD